MQEREGQSKAMIKDVVLRILWTVAFAATLLLFISRFIISTMYGANDIFRSSIYFGICIFLLYLSFIIEGIILAISKIEDYDEDATIVEMRHRHGASDTLGPNLLKMKRKSKKHTDWSTIVCNSNHVSI